MTDAAHDIVGGKCSACQNVVFEWPYNDGPPKTISPSLERIYEQPGSGCSFCQVLSYFLKRQVDIVEDTFRINRLRRATPPHLIFTFKSSDNNDHVRDWELFTLPGNVK